MYWADYDADTSHLTAMQHGIYLLLIKNYWQRGGPLPDDEIRLARIAKCSLKDWRHNVSVIREFFTVEENLWCHPRIALELSRVAAKSLKAKESALANDKRTLSKRSTDAERTPIYTEADTDTEKKEEEVGGDKSPTSYAFFGQTVRLTPQHLQRWKRTYHSIADLEAELMTLDGWWETQPAERRKNWFHPTMGMLNRKHQENLIARRDYDDGKITV
jgi:uncharacterized protein YdaU (DUF1376 family)